MTTATATMPQQSPTVSSPLGDLISFDDWDGSNHLTTTSVASSTSFSGHDNNDVNDLLSEQQNTVNVLVSGTPFCVDRRVFSQLERLPWERSSGSTHYLRGSPHLFEQVLNYLLFKSLPEELKMLSSHDKEELEVMATMLGLSELVSHLKSRSSFLHRRRTSSVTSITIPEEEVAIAEAASVASTDNKSATKETNQGSIIQKTDTAVTSEDSASEEGSNSVVEEEPEGFEDNSPQLPEAKTTKNNKNKKTKKAKDTKKEGSSSTKGAMGGTVRQGFGKVFRRATSFPERLSRNSSHGSTKSDKSSSNASTTTNSNNNKENSNNSRKSRASSLKSLGSSFKGLGGGSSRQLTHQECLAQHADLIN